MCTNSYAHNFFLGRGLKCRWKIGHRLKYDPVTTGFSVSAPVLLVHRFPKHFNTSRCNRNSFQTSNTLKIKNNICNPFKNTSDINKIK